jgi:hypothetical protein
VLEAPAGDLAFERSWLGERVLCLFELSGQAAKFPVEGSAEVLLKSPAAQLSDGVVNLPPFGFAIVSITANSVDG